ncbi:MAG TPA: hypothetical protein VNW30_05095 [Opitutaceae bacterium]|jgi:hypothetical protein|nr:hypothetical protein [Opitutaceae bacterium]
MRELDRQFRLTDTRGPKKKKAGLEPAFPGQAQFTVLEAFRDNRDGIVLPNDDLPQLGRQSSKLLS